MLQVGEIESGIELGLRTSEHVDHQEHRAKEIKCGGSDCVPVSTNGRSASVHVPEEKQFENL